MLKLGDKIISDIYLGDKKIAKVFLGAKLVYQANKPIFLDYIITDGNSYIDTEYCPNENTYIEYTWETIKAPTASYSGLFGSRVNTSIEEYHVFSTSGLNLRLDFGRYAEPNVNYKTELNTKYTIKAGLGEIYINDELVKSYTPKTGQTKNSMYLGNFNNDGTPYTTGIAQKIYPCTIYENGVLVRNFKPCIAPNGQVAMYDEVNNKYHYGQGSGEIKAGGRFVQSILFDGNSFINTGIAHQTCTIETTIRFEETGTRQLMGFGSGSGQYWGKGADSTAFEYFSGTNALDKTDVVLEYMCDDPTAPYLITHADGKTRVGSNGTKLSGFPYIIGGLITYSAATSTSYSFTGEIWVQKTYVGGELIQDLRPYVDEDGVPCFYDMVTNVKFYNKGTGTLSYTG